VGESAAAIAGQLLLMTSSSKEVQIFPHVRVDGAMALKLLGIRAKIYMDEPIPERLEFIGIEPTLFEIFDQNRLDEYIEQQGIAMAVDCSEAARMGRSGVFLHVPPPVWLLTTIFPAACLPVSDMLTQKLPRLRNLCLK